MSLSGERRRFEDALKYEGCKVECGEESALVPAELYLQSGLSDTRRDFW